MIKKTSITVVPAYGRDYLSKEDAIKDFNEKKDFQIMSPGFSGKYINKPDATYSDLIEFRIRYNKRQNVVVLHKTDIGDWRIAE